MFLVLLAISLSIDAFLVSLSQGINSIKIPLVSKIVICITSILYFGLSVLFGNQISKLIPTNIANILSILFMLIVFIFMIIQIYLPKKFDKTNKQLKGTKTILDFTIHSMGLTFKIIRDPIICDIDNSKFISIKEAILLGTALSIDSIGVGVGYSLSYHVNILQVLFVGFVQLVFLSAGNFFGLRINKKSIHNNNKLKFISCVIILIIIVLRILNI
ncbi:MAG: hypothetical protein A2Y17_05805 [Clostridiales bacterium GWF2_38_85]|nr:MAG: hypothetical protein A2Y17_05805 [Clostridiales bacterium GWF2_38_85]HBL84003.1 hypothetical protein [Clostridiales bacterium]